MVTEDVWWPMASPSGSSPAQTGFSGDIRPHLETFWIVTAGEGGAHGIECIEA